MQNRGRIIIGLVVFLALISYPVWYNVASGKAGYVPDLEKPADAEQCVRETTYMTAHHMDLLDEWRDRVVREGVRMDESLGGEAVEMSLTRTCLGCHVNKDAFCDRCHDYLEVSPYCWDCHVDPKEVR